MLQNSAGYVRGKHSIAQSFFVSPTAGMYLTKVGLYFHTKDTDATNPMPVHMELRPMVNGFPSSAKVLPGSRVTVNASAINVPADPSTGPAVETEFRFTEPLYLSGNTDYALVLTTQNNTYRSYISEVGDFELGSTEKKILKQTSMGSLFYSQNSVTFTPAQEVDLSFRLYRARFKTNSAIVRLKNAQLPKKLLVSNPFSTDSGSATVTVAHPHHGLVGNENIIISGANTVGGIDSSDINGTRTVTSMDATGYKITAAAAATSSSTGGGDSVLSTQNFPFHRMRAGIQHITPVGCNINSSIKTVTARSIAGAETAYVKPSDFSGIILNENHDAFVNQMVVDQYLETTQIAGGDSNARKSAELKLALSTNDSNIAPMIDMQRASLTLIGYHIDKQDSASATTGFNVPFNYVDETTATGGSNISNYLSRVVTLNTDAKGLRILFAANRPSGSDFLVFYRTATGDENISDVAFTKLTEETNNPPNTSTGLPALDNRFNEYIYMAGGQGGDLTPFLQFQVKICFRASNQAKAPKVKQLRVIALGV